MNAIVITELTKKYGNFTAVDGVSLSIRKGEVFSILGVNGAGKTTLIKMLACLTKPTAGDAELLGKSISKQSQDVKEKINISPQETAVADNLTVEENLKLIAGLYGQDDKTAKQSANAVIKNLGLDDEIKKKAKYLSGGMQRRLSIGMALISNPQILFLDEPTLGLDVIARRELWKLIKSIKDKVTILLTTHYLEEVEALSDRVGVMSKGKLTAVGTIDELKKQTSTKNLEEAFIILSGGTL